MADITNPESLGRLPQTDTVLFAVGFDRSVGKSIEEVYVIGLKNVMDQLPDNGQRFIYISSTGVYGQGNGEWVDESSACEPIRVGGKACLAAEQVLQESKFGPQSVILRLAGIYGAKRVPRRKDIVDKKSLTAATGGYLNLIHVEDAAEIVLAANQSDNVPSLYLVADGHPIPRLEYYRELGRRLGVPDLQITEADPDSPASQRARASKRVRADKMRRELNVQLEFEDFRQGLAASLAVDGDSSDI